MEDLTTEPIYLDHAATSPIDPQVAQAIHHTLLNNFGNPSSRHPLGLAASHALRSARQQVAQRLELRADQLTFTSGGTEAVALAMLGSARAHRSPGHVLISAIEHACVRETAQQLRQMGHEVEFIPVDGYGCIDPHEVAKRMRHTSFLVAVMHVNNETGVIQPIEAIACLVHKHANCRLLVDAVQSFGLLDTALDRLGADLLALSAHKLHGPKGVGCLARRPEIKLSALWGGGGQERGLRHGTENVPGIVGLAVASTLGRGDVATLRSHTAALLETVLDTVPRAYALGREDQRAGHIVAVALPGRRSEVLVNALAAAGLYVSSGSACQSSSSKRRSHVLEAMGVPADCGVIRLSVGRMLTAEQLRQAQSRLRQTLQAYAQ